MRNRQTWALAGMLGLGFGLGWIVHQPAKGHGPQSPMEITISQPATDANPTPKVTRLRVIVYQPANGDSVELAAPTDKDAALWRIRFPDHAILAEPVPPSQR